MSEKMHLLPFNDELSISKEAKTKQEKSGDVSRQTEQIDSFCDVTEEKMDSRGDALAVSLPAGDVSDSQIFFNNQVDEIQFNEEKKEGKPESVERKVLDEDTLQFTEVEAEAGFQPQKIETIDGTQWKTKSAEELSGSICLTQATGITLMADMMKFWALTKKFERGTLIRALDRSKNPFLLMLQIGSELMAYRYLSSELNLEIPDSVGKLPVRYLHPDIVNGLRFRSLKSNLKVDNLANASKETLKKSMAGVQSVKLPNGLSMLPPKVFYHCLALEELIVPESVTAISVDAFTGSCLKHVWFNGACPLGFKHNVRLPGDVVIHYKREFENSFKGD